MAHALLRGILIACLLLGAFCRVAPPVAAEPGLCIGPVCADQFSRSSTYPWQLRLRVTDQQGRRERLLIDCRSGVVSPLEGPLERGYATAVARRACRLDPEVLSRSAA